VLVEIWSDIACPWCYVGKRRFEAALAAFEHRDRVRVTWRAFELDPGAPPERPGDRTERLARKYGVSLTEAQAMHDRMTEEGAREGVAFDFAGVRDGNTFDAHRLSHLAAAHGVQDAMEERLFRAHLSEGRLLSDHDTLRELARDVGLPPAEVDELLAGDRFAAEVRTDERDAASAGITAVPFFAVDRSLGGAGAHPPEALLDLLRRGWERRPRLAVADGPACGPGGC